MSITHSLMIATKMTPSEVRELLLTSDLGLRPAIDDYLRGEGVHGRVSRLSSLWQKVVFADYGVHASLGIHFDMDSDEDEEEGKRIIGRTAATLLKKEDGDVVLLFNGETPSLRRINRHIVAYEGWSEWLKPALDAASIAYEMRQIEAAMA